MAETIRCREFQGPRQSKGYGVIRTPDGPQLLHRWVVEQVEGVSLADGEVVMHRCDNPPCFLYAHLRRADQSANLRDAVAKGRHRFVAHHGEANGAARLTRGGVAEIRRRHREGETQTAIAVAVGVARSTIGRIVRGETWPTR